MTKCKGCNKQCESGDICEACAKATDVSQCVNTIEAILRCPGAERELVEAIGESKAKDALCNYYRATGQI